MTRTGAPVTTGIAKAWLWQYLSVVTQHNVSQFPRPNGDNLKKKKKKCIVLGSLFN